jgi:hypothetical protein
LFYITSIIERVYPGRVVPLLSDCHDDLRLGKPLSGLGMVLREFLKQSPFASARIMARRFYFSPSTIKEILDRELGFRRISRRWVPRRLTGA